MDGLALGRDPARRLCRNHILGEAQARRTVGCATPCGKDVQLTSPPRFVQISAGKDHLLALTSDGRAFAHPITLNANSHGQLGFRKCDVPAPAPALAPTAAVLALVQDSIQSGAQRDLFGRMWDKALSDEPLKLLVVAWSRVLDNFFGSDDDDSSSSGSGSNSKESK